MDPDPFCPERLDPDQVCPEGFDPDPVNIRPDPNPWLSLWPNPCAAKRYRYASLCFTVCKLK